MLPIFSVVVVLVRVEGVVVVVVVVFVVVVVVNQLINHSINLAIQLPLNLQCRKHWEPSIKVVFLFTFSVDSLNLCLCISTKKIPDFQSNTRGSIWWCLSVRRSVHRSVVRLRFFKQRNSSNKAITRPIVAKSREFSWIYLNLPNVSDWCGRVYELVIGCFWSRISDSINRFVCPYVQGRIHGQ